MCMHVLSNGTEQLLKSFKEDVYMYKEKNGIEDFTKLK